MGFLDWLYGNAKRPSYEPEPQYVEIDWNAFENELVAAIETQIERFASKHTKETFYGFALDCNAEYGDILLCVNTCDALAKTASQYLKLRPNSTLQSEIDSLRWALGDWKYQGFNINTRLWSKQYGASLAKSDAPIGYEGIEQFMVSACRSLLRVEDSGVFNKLSRTGDFRVACVDHDENIDEGDVRLKRVRESVS